MPSNSDVEEVYLNSLIRNVSYEIHHAKISLILLFISAPSIIRLHDHILQDVIFCISLLILANFVLSYFMAKQNRKMISNALNPVDHLNLYVVKNGANLFPVLISLLIKCIKGKSVSSLENPIIYHLQGIIPQLTPEHLGTIHIRERKILCGMITAKQELWPDIPAIHLARMERIGSALTTSIIHLLGKIGDEQSIQSLMIRYNATQSTEARNLIEGILPEEVLIQSLEDTTDVKTSDSDIEIGWRESASNEDKRNAALYNFGRTIPRFVLLDIPSILLLYYWISDAQHMSFGTMIVIISLLIWIRLFKSKLPSIGGSKYVIERIDPISDDPQTIPVLLSTIRLDTPTGITQLFILMEKLKNVSTLNSITLNAKQLGILHKLLWPEKLLKGNVWVSTMKPDKVISVETVLNALAILGNESSITAVSKFANETKDPDLNLKAIDCIEAIRRKLAQSPDELLRTVSHDKTELLMSSGSATLASDLLLKVEERTSHLQHQNEVLKMEER